MGLSGSGIEGFLEGSLGDVAVFDSQDFKCLLGCHGMPVLSCNCSRIRTVTRKIRKSIPNRSAMGFAHT
jgi:hypothetical protein